MKEKRTGQSSIEWLNSTKLRQKKIGEGERKEEGDDEGGVG